MVEEPAHIQEINQQIRQFVFSSPLDISFLLIHPSENETFILPTDEEIVQQYSRKIEAHLSLEEMGDSKEPQKISPSEAPQLLVFFELFFLQQNGHLRENLTSIRLLKEALTPAHHSTLFSKYLRWTFFLIKYKSFGAFTVFY
ncbi:hypothetical protein GcM1_185011 [Golovinomyces cichoracearum]|uniref:Uncharacterized protein n=1 Tax=Golovinomyces cichoracearum TaxID=62708 RepID=A0A420J328_9PEZI|nr:hypothetical protein GcM1_185011 [Golovinomyces cichoracearum]